jgi:hypothetical protein
MGLWVYRVVVLGSLCSSVLLGGHLPAIHNMIDHGAPMRWDVVAATALLTAVSLGGVVVLLRRPEMLPSNAETCRGVR